jgi:hypothetical protein
MSVTHFKSPGGTQACSQRAYKFTSDTEDVTCKRCLRVLAKSHVSGLKRAINAARKSRES